MLGEYGILSGGGFGDVWTKIQQAFEQLGDIPLQEPVILAARQRPILSVSSTGADKRLVEIA